MKIYVLHDRVGKIKFIGIVPPSTEGMQAKAKPREGEQSAVIEVQDNRLLSPHHNLRDWVESYKVDYIDGEPQLKSKTTSQRGAK